MNVDKQQGTHGGANTHQKKPREPGERHGTPQQQGGGGGYPEERKDTDEGAGDTRR